MERRPGWTEVICGGMFAGKTEELIRRIERSQIAKQKVQVFKHTTDNRYSASEIVAHTGAHQEALAVPSSEVILKLVESDTQIVAIDEAQFFDEGLPLICNALADRGLRVVVAGLDMDFRGEPFGSMPQLMARAKKVDKLHAICTFEGTDGQTCGDDAVYTQRFVDGRLAPWEAPTVVVGADELYEARCPKHFKRPERPRE